MWHLREAEQNSLSFSTQRHLQNPVDVIENSIYKHTIRHIFLTAACDRWLCCTSLKNNNFRSNLCLSLPGKLIGLFKWIKWLKLFNKLVEAVLDIRHTSRGLFLLPEINPFGWPYAWLSIDLVGDAFHNQLANVSQFPIHVTSFSSVGCWWEYSDRKTIKLLWDFNRKFCPWIRLFPSG